MTENGKAKTVGEMLAGESPSPATLDVYRGAESVVGAMIRSEIDVQIATAKAYPRSVKRFIDEATGLATMNEKVASECIYAVPREGRTIEGPSARFGEIVLSAWGNSRAGARVIAEDGEFVTGQGFFFDVERNVSIVREIKRRIVDKHGRRYSLDMIATTANAACSIAQRNAVFAGIPKAFWQGVWENARQTAIGNAQTLVNKRAEMVAYFAKMGVTEKMILATLELPGVEDIGLDELAKLKGLATAIKEGDLTIEGAFVTTTTEGAGASKGAESLKEKVRERTSRTKPKDEPPKPEPAKAEQPKPEPAKVDPSGGPTVAQITAEGERINALLLACSSQAEVDALWREVVRDNPLIPMQSNARKMLSVTYADLAKKFAAK